MKMADIDIEEHDLLENPILKRIFPDLSILKKEIINFTEEFNYGTLNSEGDLNTTTASNTTSSCKKKNLIGHIKKKKNIKNSIVILDNISPFLKKSKRFCQTCLILFPDNSSLDAHNKFFHFNTNDFKENLKNDIIKSDSTDKKVCSSSVISDRKVVAITHKTKSPIVSMNNSLKLCVHCDVLFSSKELIDHLYDVLNTKKNIHNVKRLNQPYTNVKNKRCERNIVNLKKTFYCCPICSYYFDSHNIYSQHLVVNHHASIKVPSLAGCFSPICKFCYIRCSNKVSYNIHLHLIHKEEINKKQNLEGYSMVTSVMDKHSESKVKDITHIKKDQMETNYNSEGRISSLEDNLITRMTLFKCMKCKIFFLTLKEATNHNKHRQIIINWECLKCWRTFKEKDSYKHEKQHHLDTRFIEAAVFDQNCNDLYKCQECSVYYEKKDIFYHQNICNSTTSSSSYCEICDILIGQDIYTSHRNSHEFVNITDSLPKDNTVVGCNIAEEDQNMDRTATHDDDITHLEKASIFTCLNCNVSMNVYDEAIGHCHMHIDLNNLQLDSIECPTCKLNFVVASYDAHQDLHVSWSKDQFKQFTFDVLYFGFKNDTWIKHVFGLLPTGSIDRFIKSSIYKDECRLKLGVTQQGLAHLTIYKCDKCQSFVESLSIYNHMASCTNSKKFSCKFCDLQFVSRVSKKRHEVIHTNCIIDPKSYRIVTFNREEDKSLNKKLANIKKYHVLYQCRFCHVDFVHKRIYDKHKCYSPGELKKCSKCSLIIHESEYNLHVNNHNTKDSFNKDNIHVNLLGNDSKNISNNTRSNVVQSFSGMIREYTFFKCAKCEICVRDPRGTVEHFCLINAAKSVCPKCDLVFDKAEFKGHLRLHEIDPYFTKDTIIVKTFGEEEIEHNINSIKANTQEQNNFSFKDANGKENIIVSSTTKLYSSSSNSKTVKIFKCLCGLHFLNETTIREHSKGCSGKIKIKQSKQNCLKCGLTFSNHILFQHLLKHHKGSNGSFEYDIVEF